jgi:hypothetical protein
MKSKRNLTSSPPEFFKLPNNQGCGKVACAVDVRPENEKKKCL